MVWGLGGQGLWKVCEWGTMKGWCRTKEQGCTNCSDDVLSFFSFLFFLNICSDLRSEWLVKTHASTVPNGHFINSRVKSLTQSGFSSLFLSRSVGPGRVKCRPVVVRRTAGKFI